MWARQLCFVQATRHPGSQFLNQGLNPRPLHLKHRVLTTGQPGKFPGKLFDCLGASNFPLTRTGRVVPHRLLRGTNTKARNFKIPKILCGSLTSSRQMAGGFLKNIRLIKKKKNQVAKKWHFYVLICHGVRCLLTRGSTCWSSAFLVFLEEHGWKLNYLWLRLQCRRPWFNSWVEKICWRRDRLPTPVFWPGEFHGLQSMVSQRVGHDWVTCSISDFTIPRATVFLFGSYHTL